MSNPFVDRFPFKKTVTVLAIALVLGLGMCGLSMALPSSDEEFHTNWLSMPSLLIIFFASLGLIITVVVWIFSAVVDNISGTSSDPQKLFDDSVSEPKNNGDERIL